MSHITNFHSFVKQSHQLLIEPLTPIQSIHFTIGNESCDMDSTVAALALAYLLFKRNFNDIVIPVMNVSKENFLLKTENLFVLREANIPLDELVFRDEVDFKTIISNTNVSASLVDHHILPAKDNILKSSVVQIFDHRPVDPSYKWGRNVQIRIEPVGSCCTLIADEIFKADSTILDKTLAYLLYQTIVYDTIALKPENNKATALDIAVAAKLKEKFNFAEDAQTLFDKLWEAHVDVSHLWPNQLLMRDLKVVEGVYVPGLPMLVKNYLKLPGSMEAIEEFAVEHKVTCLLIIGLEASHGVQRDLAIYSKSTDDGLRTALLSKLMAKKDEFLLEVIPTEFREQILLMNVNNTKISRKELVPIVKEAWKLYKNSPNGNT